MPVTEAPKTHVNYQGPHVAYLNFRKGTAVVPELAFIPGRFVGGHIPYPGK